MKRPVEIELTPAQESACAKLGNLLHAYPLDVLDAVLRAPETQADFGVVLDRALSKQLDIYRGSKPRPIAWTP